MIRSHGPDRTTFPAHSDCNLAFNQQPVQPSAGEVEDAAAPAWYENWSDMLPMNALIARVLGDQFAKEAVAGRFAVLDAHSILAQRGDAHTGTFAMQPGGVGIRSRNGWRTTFTRDCLHWCQPGPIDTVVTLLFDLMQRMVGVQGRAQGSGRAAATRG